MDGMRVCRWTGANQFSVALCWPCPAGSFSDTAGSTLRSWEGMLNIRSGRARAEIWACVEHVASICRTLIACRANWHLGFGSVKRFGGEEDTLPGGARDWMSCGSMSQGKFCCHCLPFSVGGMAGYGSPEGPCSVWAFLPLSEACLWKT